MKTLVLTAFDETYAPLGELTWPLMEDYAMRHGYDFRLRRTRPIEWQEAHLYFWKLFLVHQAMEEGFERVLWLDADQVVTNPERSMDNYHHGIHLSQDWGLDALELGQFSCGAYVACLDTLPVFDWCLQHAHHYRSAPFGDQDAMRDYFANLDRHSKFHIHQRRQFNAVHPLVHASAPEPWQPGDFLCHLTMLPLAARIALFHTLRTTHLCNS